MAAPMTPKLWGERTASNQATCAHARLNLNHPGSAVGLRAFRVFRALRGSWPKPGFKDKTPLAAMLKPRIEPLKERHVAVVEHHGPVETIDQTRRPLYRHMIIHELVGGPSIIRFLDHPKGDRQVDALVMTHAGFEGDEVCRIAVLPKGPYAVADYE